MLNIFPSVAWCTGVAVAVTGYMFAFENHLFPEGMPSLAIGAAPSAFVNMTSVALSLLLVFRTNSVRAF